MKTPKQLERDFAKAGIFNPNLITEYKENYKFSKWNSNILKKLFKLRGES